MKIIFYKVLHGINPVENVKSEISSNRFNGLQVRLKNKNNLEC